MGFLALRGGDRGKGKERRRKGGERGGGERRRFWGLTGKGYGEGL